MATRWLRVEHPPDRQVLELAEAERSGQTLFLTAFLVGAQNVHGGGFNWRYGKNKGWRFGWRSLIGTLKSWRSNSPGLCTCLTKRLCELHIVHDLPQPELADQQQLRDLNVTAHAFKSDPTVLNNDRRFVLFEHVLREHPSWDCAFMTDIDVWIVTLPPCQALKRAGKLVFGSDDLKSTLPVKNWLNEKAKALRYNASSEFRRFLCPTGRGCRSNISSSSDGPRSQPSVSPTGKAQDSHTSGPSFKSTVVSSRRISFVCSMLGGPRDVLLSALTTVVSKLENFWSQRPELRKLVGLDMLVWADAALPLYSRGDVVTGYPYGPANPPLSWHPYAHGIRGSDANQSLAFMNATRGMFWLSHRPQSAWLALFRNWVKECHDEDQVRDVRRIVFGRR